MKQLTLPISPLLPNHVVVSLALTLSFIASANAEDDPRITISSENVKASEYAVVRLRKGLQIEGKVIRLSKDSLTISHKRLGKTVPASNPLETIAAIQLGEFVCWRAANGSFHSERAAEWHRRGVVTVVNNTDEDVTFTITSIKNPDAVVEDLEEESPTGISLFLQRPRQSAVAWKLRQGERTRLSYQGLDVITSHIMYSLKTSNGTTRTGATNSDGRAGFVVEIKPSDLHSPLLVEDRKSVV